MSCIAESGPAAGPRSTSGRHKTTLSDPSDGVNLGHCLSLYTSISSHEKNAANLVY